MKMETMIDRQPFLVIRKKREGKKKSRTGIREKTERKTIIVIVKNLYIW